MMQTLSFSGFAFLQPWWLLLLLLLPVFILIHRWMAQQYFPSMRFADLSSVHDALRSPKRYLIKAVRMLYFIAATALILAMSRPKVPVPKGSQETVGIDIVLAMDISLSMLARDFNPDRLEASRNVAARFINDRGPDRIGIILFAGQTFTLCPLTTDKAALVSLLQQAQAGFIEDGSTAIGDGIATAINRLRDSEAISKVIILLTDGENNAGNVDPLQAAEIAQLFGIRLYTIGVGSYGTAIGPVQIINGKLLFGPVEVNIDEGTLRTAAEMTGGKYFRAADEKMLGEVYREIDQLEKSRIESTVHLPSKELYPELILFSLLVLLMAGWIRFLWIKTLP